jgi:long-subunit acyl-CoA synthetase (AMP-forming)
MELQAPPARPRALDAPTLSHAFQLTAAERADEVALRTPGDGVAITWREYAARVEAIAGGLAALGVERGDAVGLLLLNRPEFHLLDTAILHLGAVPFSIYSTSTTEQVTHQLRNAGCRVVATESRFLPVVLAARRELAALEHVVQIDGADDDIVRLAELEGSGASAFRFAETWQAVGPDDLAALIYTSGTTGPPKGVELTHANAMAECVAWDERFPVTPGGRTISYLPTAHVVDRFSNHWWASISLGFTLTSVADMRAALFQLPSVRPTIFGAVPRIWEKLHEAVQGMPEGAAARLGLDAAEQLGGGAAPMPIDVLRDFEALGLPIAEAWGMSETSGAATANPPGDIRAGTCGTPLAGVEIDLAPDGELLLRGPTVMRGYRDDPEATAQAFDADGWLRTGDVAHVADGYVAIVDRKKELIVTAGGKNLSPANIESRLEAASPLIGHAAAIGDRRPYVTALIALDPDAAVDFATAHGLDDASVTALATHPEVRSRIAAAVEAANDGLGRVERVKRFAILPTEWRPGGDELTPTLKLKRRAIALRYAAEIEELYSGSGRFSPGQNPVR